MSYSNEVLADAPSGYWRLEETAGTVAADSSGNARNAAISGGVTLGQPPLISVGKSYQLDGVNGQALAPAAAYMAGALAGQTLELWIKTTSAVINLNFLGSDNGVSNRWFQFRITPTVAQLVLYNTAVSVFTITAKKTINDGAAHHVVAGVDTANHMFIYTDGQEDAAAAVNFSGSQVTVNNGIWIGQRGNGSLWFPGFVDEVAVYPTPLSAARILAHYQAGIASGGGGGGGGGAGLGPGFADGFEHAGFTVGH